MSTEKMISHLAHIREAGGRTNRFLQTINANIIQLDSSVRQMTEALKVLTRELTRDVDLDKLVEDSKKIAEAGKNFEEIAGTQEDGFVYHTSGHDLDIGSQTVPPRTWIKLGAGELPSGGIENAGNPYVTDTDGRLFPWQWRHNLGFDKISEDLREYHRTHENHPMTEEAFRIYNAGLTSEKVAWTSHEMRGD